MDVRNDIIGKHYSCNFNKLVNRLSWSFGGNVSLSEECIQESYTRALKFFYSYDIDRAPFQTWFNSILRNTIKDFKKSDKSKISTSEEDVLNSIPDINGGEEFQFRREICNKVEKDFSLLSPKARTAVHLYFFKNLLPHEIEKNTKGLSKFSVRKYVHQAQQTMEASYAP